LLRVGIRYLSGRAVFRARVRRDPAPVGSDLKSGKLYDNAIVADVFDFPRDDGYHSVLIQMSPYGHGIVIFIDGVIKGEGTSRYYHSKQWAGAFAGRYGIAGPHDQFGDDPSNAWPTPLGPLYL
jgi:hypothetical protein